MDPTISARLRDLPSVSAVLNTSAAATLIERYGQKVAETNQGGDMVTEVLRQSEPNLPVRAVHATRGKFLRAEPIAAAYERSLVFHVGTFSKLEDQLCALTPDFDRRAMGFSPDRADALVWALADLLGEGQTSAGGMYEFWTGTGRESADQKAR